MRKKPLIILIILAFVIYFGHYIVKVVIREMEHQATNRYDTKTTNQKYIVIKLQLKNLSNQSNPDSQTISYNLGGFVLSYMVIASI